MTTLIYLLILVAILAGFWKTFVKAGLPGFYGIIPIVNLFFLVKMSGKPWWWVILFLIPLVNIVVAVLVCIEVAKKFEQSALFGVGLAILGFIFFPILGFGSAEWKSQPVDPSFSLD